LPGFGAFIRAVGVLDGVRDLAYDLDMRRLFDGLGIGLCTDRQVVVIVPGGRQWWNWPTRSR
jgi:hypothetical protein